MPFVARTLSPETSSIIETIADNPNSARRFFPSFVFVEWLSKFFKSPLQLAKTRSFRVRGVGWRGEGKGEGEKEVRCCITFVYTCVYVRLMEEGSFHFFDFVFEEEIGYLIGYLSKKYFTS